MKINITCEINNTKIDEIKNIEKILNFIQDYYKFQFSTTYQINLHNAKSFDWEYFYHNYTHRTNEPVIFVMEQLFKDNHFFHVGEGFAVITIKGCEELYDLTISSYLIYCIAAISIAFDRKVDENEAYSIIGQHGDIGCLFDVCMEKINIKMGMRSGNICKECLQTLFQYGMKNECLSAIKQMLDWVKSTFESDKKNRGAMFSMSNHQINNLPYRRNITIFISYNREYSRGEAIAFEKILRNAGFTTIRDDTNLGNILTLNTFMQNIRECNYALFLITDRFLKSINCMFEACQFSKELYHEERMFFAVYETSIYGENCWEYIRYWKEEKERYEKKLKDLGISDTERVQDIRLQKYKIIEEFKVQFLQTIMNSHNLDTEDLKKQIVKQVKDRENYIQYRRNL